MNLMRGIDLKKMAEKMNGASGAELKVEDGKGWGAGKGGGNRIVGKHVGTQVYVSCTNVVVATHLNRDFKRSYKNISTRS